jgi:hypothetical protein
VDDGICTVDGIADERGVRHVADDHALGLEPELPLVPEHRCHADAELSQLADDHPAKQTGGTRYEDMPGE